MAKIDLERLAQTPPWDWPQDVGTILLEVLADRGRPVSDRILAAELAGDLCAMSDRVAVALLAIAEDRQEPEAVRGQAAIACGPALELVEEGFDQSETGPISEEIFLRMREVLRRVYDAGDERDHVRRCALEASVRAPQDWHLEAIRAAFRSEAEDWMTTAVFCMRFVAGFKAEIEEAVRSDNEKILGQALLAAGVWGIEEAWPRVAALLSSKRTPKPLLLRAIEASAGMDAEGALDLLTDLLAAEDEEVADAANEALMELSPLRRAGTAGYGPHEDDAEWAEDWMDDWDGEPPDGDDEAP